MTPERSRLAISGDARPGVNRTETLRWHVVLKSKVKSLVGVVILAGAVAACTSNVRQHGAVISSDALTQVPIGSSKQQVRLALGSPSTTSSVDGEAFYYISQRIEERAFFRPRETDRRVVVVEFDDSETVTRIAEFGLKDGQVFDFTTETTPTGGNRTNLIRQILRSTRPASPF